VWQSITKTKNINYGNLPVGSYLSDIERLGYKYFSINIEDSTFVEIHGKKITKEAIKIMESNGFRLLSLHVEKTVSKALFIYSENSNAKIRD